MKTKITYDLRVSPVYSGILLGLLVLFYGANYFGDFTNSKLLLIIAIALVVAVSAWFFVRDIKKLHIANLHYILTVVAGIALVVFMPNFVS